MTNVVEQLKSFLPPSFTPIYIKRDQPDCKELIETLVGQSCRECFVDSLFKGRLLKEKDSLLIFQLDTYYNKDEAIWIINHFEKNWNELFYSKSENRLKILNSEPEIFVIRKNSKLFCIVNFIEANETNEDNQEE